MRFIVGLILCLSGLSSWSIVSSEAIKQDSIDSPSGKNSLGALIKSAARKSAIREAEAADGCEGVEWTDPQYAEFREDYYPGHYPDELRKNRCLDGISYGSRYRSCWKQCSHGGNTVCGTGSTAVTTVSEDRRYQAEECSRLSQSCSTACFDNWEELDATIIWPTLAPTRPPRDNGCDASAEGVAWMDEDPVYDLHGFGKTYWCKNGVYYGTRRGRCWKQCSHGGNTWCETGEWSFKEPKQIGAHDCAQISQSCKTSCYDNWTELDALNPLKPTDNGCEGEYPVDDEWLIPKLYCENGTYWGSHRGRCWRQCSHGSNTWTWMGLWSTDNSWGVKWPKYATIYEEAFKTLKEMGRRCARKSKFEWGKCQPSNASNWYPDPDLDLRG